jgi:hypothetical protein
MNNSKLHDYLQASYLPQNQAEQLLNKRNLKLDRNLSSMETKVFVNENNRPVILQRGTTNAKDILDDGLLAMGLGKYASRTKNAERLAQKVTDKYGKKPDVFGHSLGGFYAEQSGNKAHKITTFNKATEVKDMFKSMPKNQTDVRTLGDVISLPSTTQKGNKKTINNKTGYAHGLKNLLFV